MNNARRRSSTTNRARTVSDINEIAAAELARRLRTLSTAELITLAQGVKPAAQASQRPTQHESGPRAVVRPLRPSSRPGAYSQRGAITERPTLTLADAVLLAVETSPHPLTSTEIVEEVMKLRPDSHSASIRSEISRLVSNRRLHRSEQDAGSTVALIRPMQVATR
jgi:hypothetical protein